jgi:hypothetical protein
MTATIPNVKQQLKNWSSGRSAKDAEAPQRETLDARKLTILGHVGRSQFATAPDGRELKLRGPIMNGHRGSSAVGPLRQGPAGTEPRLAARRPSGRGDRTDVMPDHLLPARGSSFNSHVERSCALC